MFSDWLIHIQLYIYRQFQCYGCDNWTDIVQRNRGHNLHLYQCGLLPHKKTFSHNPSAYSYPLVAITEKRGKLWWLWTRPLVCLMENFFKKKIADGTLDKTEFCVLLWLNWFVFCCVYVACVAKLILYNIMYVTWLWNSPLNISQYCIDNNNNNDERKKQNKACTHTCPGTCLSASASHWLSFPALLGTFPLTLGL